MDKLLITLLSVLLVVPMCGQKIATNEQDEFTGVKEISTSAYMGSSPRKTDKIDTRGDVYTYLSYFPTEDGTELFLLYMVLSTKIDFGCLSEYEGKIILLFDNGERLTLKQRSDTDCSSDLISASYYLFEDFEDETWEEAMWENWAKIKTTLVKKIRVYGTEGYYDYELKPDKKDIWIKHANLISNLL